MENVRSAFQKRAEETGVNDLLALKEILGGSNETHDVQILHADEDRLEIEVSRCAHSEIFSEHNAEDLGEQFMCAGDFAMIEGFNPRIRLERPCVLMNGGKACRFIYTLEE